MKLFKTFGALILASALVFGLVGCASSSSASSNLKDGTYSAVGAGRNGDVPVTVTVSGGKITAVDIGENQETIGIGDLATKSLPGKIIAAQSAQVDAVAGATITSNAIIDAAKKALADAGMTASSSGKARAGKITEEKAQIVVVGGGASGMLAAVTAARAGKDVLVIEKGANISVANGWTCGGPMASNTSIQAAEGLRVTDEMLFNDLTDDAYLTSDSKLLRRVIARTGTAIETQIAAGFPMYLRPDNYGAGYRSRHGYRIARAERADLIQKYFEKAGGRVMTETAGESLIVEGGKVVGISAKKSNGDTVNIRADAVLLATGGYLGNGDIVKEHWGNIVVNPLGNTLSTGDAIRMGLEVGAMLEESSFAMISNEFGGSNRKGGGWDRANAAMTIGVYGGMIVDPLGERFFNEYYMANQPLSVGGEAVLRAGKFYLVIDQAYVDGISKDGLMKYLGNPRDWYVGNMTVRDTVLDKLPEHLDAAIKQGWAVKANTIEECASFFGLKNLPETVANYNKYCAQGHDDEFFKNPIFLKSIEKGPYYVIEYEPSAWGTLGGLRVDSQLRVTNSNLEPIPGLYAAGVDAGSLYCQPYYQVEGTAVGLAFGSGVLAAETMIADMAK